MSGRPAVCKFYKQGHCSYGNNCRFYHPPQSGSNSNNGNYNNNSYNNNYSGGYNSYNNRGRNNNSYGNNYGSNNANNTTNTNSPQMAETPQQFCDPRSIGRRETEIKNDMNDLQEMLSLSNHIFTSYSLKPPVNVNILPQRDLSYEEDRLQYYIAKSNDSIPHYQQRISNRHKDMTDSVNFLKSNTQRSVRYLQLSVQNPNLSPKPLIPPVDIDLMSSSTTSNSIFGSLTSASSSGSTPSNPFNRQANPFGGGPGLNPTGTFGSTTVSGGAFGNQSLNSSPFASLQSNTSSNNTNANPITGNTSSPFGQSGFGNTATSAFGSSGFGSTTSSNPFGASSFVSSTASNPFGAAASATNASTKASTNSTFGNSSFGNASFGNSGFGKSPFATQSTSATSAPNSSAQPNPFGTSLSNKSTNPFGGSSQSTNSPFGNVGSTTNPGGVMSSNNAFQSNARSSAFEKINASSFGNQQMKAYKQSDIGEEQTMIDNIKSEEILALFKDSSFYLGRVPDIPPPIELC